ncbi:Sm protein (macronuclear) [Tetrahymena thermophila SB210]|uniref:Sm protein n=1 Tax=Tetrahymena thermophila (strain SB210) TaxID=312017 RepID=I7MMH1_TETTS|nr:Sm protein [Tetrahymena thermophila SB210]EAS04845.2 Sm protein [Tetrahymena thermophila SB210]|eukprot:XP_001025090.2 Sm protein [Tetrahymena thermophila SB210]
MLSMQTQTQLQNNSIVKNNNSSALNDKYSEQEYSNYIDSSDVVIQIYKNSSAVGLEKYFLKIEEWLDRPLNSQEENKPYVIEADEGVGKKTLLVKWMEYHETKKKKRYPDIILSHFASSGGNNANYFFAIYRILNKLREALDIQQKVELLEEKLRKYFSYWLNHCSDKLEKQLKYGEKVNYDKVIIIIEGIDQFIDQQYNKEANVAFWLPKFFPEHIKLIVTCDKSSQANSYFRSIGCDILKIPVEVSIVQNMIDRHSKRPLFINDTLKEKHINFLKHFDEKCKNQSFYKIFLCSLLPYPVDDIITQQDIPEGTFEKIFEKLDYDKLAEVKDFNQLIEFILDFYSNSLMNKDKFIKLLRVFTLTQKGLTIEEIMGVTLITEDEWKLFLACFKVFILSYKGMWIMNNDALKKVINEKFKQDQTQLRLLHQDIAQILGKITPNSIRKLEEQTYHLFMSKDHFKLKEIISAIENFLLLFNPNNKYDLCRYWQNLEEQGFDPVIEYNKAIEGFEMHYHPSSQDVFRIIVQISRFLKEFSDFETYFTPEFRHPPVKGTYEELDDIGLLRELLGLQIFTPTEAEEGDKPIDLDKFQRTPEEKIADKKERMKHKNKKESTLKKKSDQDDPYGETQKSSNNQQIQKKEKKPKKFMILSKIEALNVDIPSSREQFRKFYENQIKEIMKQNNQNHTEENENEDGDEESSSSGDEDSENVELKTENQNGGMPSFIDKDKSKKKKKCHPQIITLSQLRESYYLKERLPTNYYYKRWLWVQFPWACLSLKCDYSAKLKECFSSPIEYMSVKKEKEFTKQALKIAIEAKLKKQMMYKKQNMSDSQSMIKPIGGGDSILIKTNASYQNLPSLNTNRKTKSLLNQSNSQNINVGQSSLQPNGKEGTQTIAMKRNLRHSNGQSPFYITDEYLNQNTLNRELEITHANTTTGAGAQNINLNQSQTYNLQNTSKILEKSRVFKDKSRFFDPISSIQDSQNLSTILPRLKSNIATHSNKELYLLEQQALDMKKELDHLIHTNKCLAKNLKELKVHEHIQHKYGTNPEKVDDAQTRIMDLEKNISETEENYLLGLMQIERLKSILKICEDNKQQNEDWIRNLNMLLSNFRKVIKQEQEDIKSIKEECNQLQKLNKEYVIVFQEKMDAQKTLINQINKQIKSKEKFDSMFVKTDNMIEQSAIEQVEKLKSDLKGQDNRKKQKDKQSQLEKNSKQILEQLEKAEAQYQKLKQVIDISDPNYSSSEKFQFLLTAREKRDDLTAIVLQRQDVISNLKQRLEDKQSYLETVKKAYSSVAKEQDSQGQNQNGNEQSSEEGPNQEDLSEEDYLQKIANLESQYENKQRQYNKLQQVRLSASMTISTIQRKLQIEQATDVRGTIDFSDESIIANLDDKMVKIKEQLPAEEYELFVNGKYDFSKVYRKLITNIGIPDYDDDQADILSNREI